MKYVHFLNKKIFSEIIFFICFFDENKKMFLWPEKKMADVDVFYATLFFLVTIYMKFLSLGDFLP